MSRTKREHLEPRTTRIARCARAAAAWGGPAVLHHAITVATYDGGMIEPVRARAAQLSAALLGVLALALAPAPGLAAQPDRVVPVGDGEALVIPAASPLELSGVGLDTAAFSGQFLVTGIFTYEGCGRGKCDGQPLDDGDLELRIVPDPAVADGLPHWKARRNKVAITLDNPEDFLRSVIT